MHPGAGRGSPADGAVGRSGAAKGPQAEGTAHECAVLGGFLELKERNQ